MARHERHVVLVVEVQVAHPVEHAKQEPVLKNLPLPQVKQVVAVPAEQVRQVASHSWANSMHYLIPYFFPVAWFVENVNCI